MSLPIIKAIGILKNCCAVVNYIYKLDPKVAKAICQMANMLYRLNYITISFICVINGFGK